jgi:TRAP-type transport system periplasmic protein
MSIRYDQELVEMLQAEHGVQVTRPDTAEFRERLEPIQAQLASQLGLEAEHALLRGAAD